MKNVTNILATAALALATLGNQVYAKTTKILTDSDWKEIEESIETENMLLLEDVATANFTQTNALQIEFAPGNYTNTLHLALNAPIANDQVVGVAVIDANGEIVYNTTGNFTEVKSLIFDLYKNWDMNYVVRIYTDEAVYESKVQVVYR